MKIYFIIIAVMLFYTGYAQTQTTDPDAVAIAKTYKLLNKNSMHYQPDKALEIYLGIAAKGNGQAMNAVANIYAIGIGRKADNTEALNWYKKATEAQYQPAWHNLAVMHKYGYGTSQNFEAAYQAYSNGAKFNITGCLYGQAYMLYKGLGVAQNYTQAVQVFKQASALKESRSMYMLGLCYRNGYGIALNLDSAKYWLQKATDAGRKAALDELLDPHAEIKAKENSSQQNTAKVAMQVAITPNIYKNTKQNVKAKEVIGSYQGLLVKYDWSGQHIIQKSTLTLTLYNNKNQISGTWLEDDSLSIAINATLTDSNLVFNQTKYQKADYYSRDKKTEFEFREASLKLNKVAKKNFITGNIQLWNNSLQEPDRKIYISLMEVIPQPVTVLQTMALQQTTAAAKPSLENHVNLDLPLAQQQALQVYPNPFGQQINLSFYMATAGNANITVTDMYGKVMYSNPNQLFKQGLQNHSFSNNFAAGSYILQLQHHGKTETTVLIKQ